MGDFGKKFRFLRELWEAAQSDRSPRGLLARMATALLLRCLDKLLSLPLEEMRVWTVGIRAAEFRSALEAWGKFLACHLDSDWPQGIETMRNFHAGPFLRRYVEKNGVRELAGEKLGDQSLKLRTLVWLASRYSVLDGHLDLILSLCGTDEDATLNSRVGNSGGTSPWFFKGTLKENLLLHNPFRQTDQQIWNALERVGLFHKVFEGRLLNARWNAKNWTFDEMRTLELVRSSLVGQLILEDDEVFLDPSETPSKTSPTAAHCKAW